MERRGGNMTRTATIETVVTEEDTTIKPVLANTSESSGEIIQTAHFSRVVFLGNILFLLFDKGIQSGENTFYVQNIGIALDAVSPMVFAKVLSKEFIDIAS